MPYYAEIEITNDYDREIVIAQNLGKQIAQGDFSDTEIWSTIEDAFSDENIRILALHAVLCERIQMQSRKEHRLRKLQSWRDR